MIQVSSKAHSYRDTTIEKQSTPTVAILLLIILHSVVHILLLRLLLLLHCLNLSLSHVGMCLWVHMRLLCKHGRNAILLGSRLRMLWSLLLLATRVREVEVGGRHGSIHAKRHIVGGFCEIWMGKSIDSRDSLSRVEL